MTTKRKAIVIVDDEKSYVDLLASMLTENLGCPVVTFTRPLEALAALPGIDAGIVVTDYCMPQLNGIEFIEKACGLLPSIPFILISGHALEFTEQKAGAFTQLCAVLAKPLGWRRLADTILHHAPEFATNPADAAPDDSAG